MIEDDEGHARLIEKNIRRAGVGNEIIPFVNGTDALNYLLGDDRSGAASAKRQQLILLDLNLPDMTGIDILQKLKGNKHTKRSPIVVLTTTDDSREIQRCYDLGANVYIRSVCCGHAGPRNSLIRCPVCQFSTLTTILA